MSEPVVFLNGLTMELKRAHVSILDRGFSYGDGIFETMRSYRGTVFRLGVHLERLFNSAELIRIDLPVTRGELKSAIYTTLEKNKCPDSIIRLTLTRGEQFPGLRIDTQASPTIAIFVRPVDPLPREYYDRGVKISLFPNSASRISGISRQVKSCNYLSHIMIRELAGRENSQEGIFLDERERIAEGTTSNVFVVKNGVLKTPELNEYVLPGITRQFVLELARDRNISCLEQALTREDIYQADEVFLTNTGVEILPVRQADQQIIGSGKPGEMTQNLHRVFLKTIDG